MPQFNAYPATRAQTFDLPAIMEQAQRLKGMRTQNRLREFQMQSAQGEQGRQAQLRGIIPGVMAGDQGALGQAAALDPSMIGELLKIPKAQRDQARQKVEQIADLLAPLADPNIPELQKAQMYPQILQRAQQLDLSVDKAPRTYDRNWVAMTMAEAGKYKNALDQADVLSPEAEAQKIRIAKAKRAPEKPLAIERKLRLAGIDPNSEEGQDIILADLLGQQIEIEQIKDGGFRVRIGKGTSGDMEKKTRGDIEKKLVGAREGLSRLRGIAAKFKPEYQEIPTRLGVAWTGLKARFGQGGIDPKDRQLLTSFADYRRDAISNINLYIKDITGAQMSATETDRLRLATPDPGEGIFGGDDPITFEAKLNSAIRDLEKAAVRYEYYLGQGITDPEEMARQSPLPEMRTAVNEQTGERLVEIAGQWVSLQ